MKITKFINELQNYDDISFSPNDAVEACKTTAVKHPDDKDIALARLTHGVFNAVVYITALTHFIDAVYKPTTPANPFDLTLMKKKYPIKTKKHWKKFNDIYSKMRQRMFRDRYYGLLKSQITPKAKKIEKQKLF